WSLEVAALSGDWRRFEPGGPLRLVAALGVNVPGFPIPDVAAVTAGGECTALVAAGARTMGLVASAQRPHAPRPPARFTAATHLAEQIDELRGQVATLQRLVAP